MMSSARHVYRSKWIWLKQLLALSGFVTLANSHQPLFAQFCANPSGSLVINQTFGTAAQPISIRDLSPYQYVPPTCPGDGQFTVTETIDGSCFNYTWYAVLADHSPDDVNGNMMVVNGANTPGVFYQQTVSGLCSGSTYELSLWASNLLKAGICPTPLVPNIRINIETKDGHILSSTNLGSVDLTGKPVWRRYVALFTAPRTRDELVVKLLNTTGDFGCGNDMVIDDIQLRQCEACASDQVYVPDAFTPNSDGQNDVLAFFLPKVSSFRLAVYNRWGALIFTSTDVNQKWDGTYAGAPCDTGTYSWIVSYTSSQANQESTEHTQTGQVLLIR